MLVVLNYLLISQTPYKDLDFFSFLIFMLIQNGAGVSWQNFVHIASKEKENYSSALGFHINLLWRCYLKNNLKIYMYFSLKMNGKGAR